MLRGRVLERFYWWWMRRTSVEATVRGVDFVYVSARDQREPSEILAALGQAFETIAQAGGGFGELVFDQLRFVAAVDAPRAWVASHARGYVSPFYRAEVEHPHILACRLVYAATVVRLSHDALRAHRKLTENIIELAHEAQLRFVRQFPGWQDWETWLEKHRL